MCQTHRPKFQTVKQVLDNSYEILTIKKNDLMSAKFWIDIRASNFEVWKRCMLGCV